MHSPYLRRDSLNLFANTPLSDWRHGTHSRCPHACLVPCMLGTGAPQSMRILVKENTAEPVQYTTKFFSGPTVYGKQLGYNQVPF